MTGTAEAPVAARDSDTVESQQTASGQRKALIIANNEYDDEALGNLRAPEADAEALARVLGDPLIGGFSVEVISNQPSGAIKRRIDDLFSECQPDDGRGRAVITAAIRSRDRDTAVGRYRHVPCGAGAPG